jgi:hypothetical protein
VDYHSSLRQLKPCFKVVFRKLLSLLLDIVKAYNFDSTQLCGAAA